MTWVADDLITRNHRPPLPDASSWPASGSSGAGALAAVIPPSWAPWPEVGMASSELNDFFTNYIFLAGSSNQGQSQS